MLSTMNITPALFRKLLLLSIVFGVIGALIDIMLPHLIPDPLYQAQEKVEQLASSTENIILIILGVPILITFIISAVGLFYFHPWAPRVALITTLLTFVIYPFFGYYLSSGWAMAFTDCSTMLWGMILTLTYCSPIRKCFVRKNHAPIQS
jgi:hypothetical protein